MLRRTIQCVDPVMTAFQAPQASPARAHSDQPAAADAQPDVPPKEKAEAGVQAVTPKPPPQEPRVTTEDMSGWAMGGSD